MKTRTRNEEKISNNLFDLQFHIVEKKKEALQNLKNVVGNKYTWTWTLYFNLHRVLYVDLIFNS